MSTGKPLSLYFSSKYCFGAHTHTLPVNPDLAPLSVVTPILVPSPRLLCVVNSAFGPVGRSVCAAAPFFAEASSFFFCPPCGEALAEGLFGPESKLTGLPSSGPPGTRGSEPMTAAAIRAAGRRRFIRDSVNLAGAAAFWAFKHEL